KFSSCCKRHLDCYLNLNTTDILILKLKEMGTDGNYQIVEEVAVYYKIIMS
ncbi:hypothetical protein XELAEV_180273322mg, partial [Xenopus laevis]